MGVGTDGGGGRQTPARVVRRLLEGGVLGAADVVDGGVVLSDLSQSNCVYAVDDAAGRKLVVKAGRAERPLDEGSREREHDLYRAVAGNPVVAPEAPVPGLVADFGDLLVLRRVTGADTLGAHYRAGGLAAVDGAAFGRAIGVWHRLGDVLLEADPAWPGPGRPPWVLRSLSLERSELVALHPPLAELADRLHQIDGLVATVEEAAARWRPTAVIHGDIRWDNALAADGGAPVTLVDWEFADHGDAGWDVASAVAEAMVAVFVDRAVELDAVVPAVAGHVEALVAGYLDGRGDRAADQAQDAVRSAARLVPARLLLAAFQHAAWMPFTGVETGAGLGRLAAEVAVEAEQLLEASIRTGR